MPTSYINFGAKMISMGAVTWLKDRKIVIGPYKVVDYNVSLLLNVGLCK